MPTSEVIESVAALILCGVFIRLVMRGRWIRWSHPICSRCQFNLQGLPETSERCPECGEDLSKVRRNEVWRRRWISLGFSLLLVLLTAFVVFQDVGLRRVNAALPTFVIFQEERIPSLRGDAISILHQRLGEGSLSDSQKLALLNIALANPGGSIQSWLLREFQNFNQVPPAVLGTLAQKALNGFGAIRPVVGRDEPLVVRITTTCSPLFEFRCTASIAIDGQPVNATAPQVTIPISGGPYPYPNEVTYPNLRDAFAPLKDGEHTINFTLNTRAINPATGQVAAQRKLSNSMPFTLAPPGQSGTKVVVPNPENLRRQQAYLAVQEIYLDGAPPKFRHFGVGSQTSWSDVRARGDINLAYQIWIHEGASEQLLGKMIFTDYEGKWFPAKDKPHVGGKTVDLVFRPDPALAATDFRTSVILGGEFTIKNVPVKQAAPLGE